MGVRGRWVCAPRVDEGGRHEVRIARQQGAAVVVRSVPASQVGRRVPQPQQAGGLVRQLVVVA
ncbi:hypothetical protein ACFQ77_09850 [Streptomyces virginiae]|uniref:hypothetical protein n=1 Tax=Streptomyces virginiae TaxID=1961 RepID=UPI0036A4631E